MRFCAVSCSQRWVAAWSMSIWPESTSRVPSSKYGCRVSIAPSQNRWALLSSSEPANSSTFSGPSGASSAGSKLSSSRPSPYSRALAWFTPTL